jgi:hypothetical protein
VSCQKLKADSLAQVDNVVIDDVYDEKVHKVSCERAFTLLHQHKNCVIHMDLTKRKPDEPRSLDEIKLPPINLSNLETSKLEPFGEKELEFSQNTVPFDFDG